MIPLLLLHGALGSAAMFDQLSGLMPNDLSIHCLNFEGHGGQDFNHPVFSIENFALQVIGYLDYHEIPVINVFGYSMGGFVGLYLANHFPERIGKIATLATKLNWNPEIAKRETSMLNLSKMEIKVPAFVEELRQRHAPQDISKLMNYTIELLTTLGNENPLSPEALGTIECPVMLAVGDRDSMVSVEETMAAYRVLPKGQFWVIPSTPHPFERVDVQRLVFELSCFFNPSS